MFLQLRADGLAVERLRLKKCSGNCIDLIGLNLRSMDLCNWQTTDIYTNSNFYGSEKQKSVVAAKYSKEYLNIESILS